MGEQLKILLRDIAYRDGLISDMLKGQTVEIVSNFNDQPHGRSKPSLKGKRFIVKGAYVETRHEGEIHVQCEGLWCFPQLWRDAVLVKPDSAGGSQDG